MRVSTNQVTCATILNIEKIMIKNDTTFMVMLIIYPPDISCMVKSRTENIRKMKIVKTKCHVQQQKEGIHQHLNNEMAIRGMRRRKMNRMRSRIERATRIKIP
jgi:hypothetical protein